MSNNSIIPGVQGNGTLFNKLGLVKRNLTEDLNQGLKNPWHYLDTAGLAIDANIGDGSTNSRAALTAADADGPITLPPGTYAVATNLTLTNNVKFEPGAVFKPASGVALTIPSFTADDTQQVFDLSAGGTVVVTNQKYVTINHYGAVGDGVTDNVTIIDTVLELYKNSEVPIYVPKGSFLCSDSLITGGSGTGHINIFGGGKDSEIYFTGATDAAIDNGTMAYVKIENLKIRGNNIDAHGIRCYVTTNDVTIENCDVSGFGTTTGNGGQIYCEDVDKVTIIRNECYDGGGTTSLQRDILLLNCTDITVIGNRTLSENSEGISISATTTTRMNGVVLGNTSKYHHRHGIILSYDGDISELSVVGNYIDDCWYTGIYVAAGTSEPNISYVGNLSITSNTVMNCAGGDAGDGNGNASIHLGGRAGGTCSANTIINSGYDTTGAARGGTSLGRGILLGYAANWSLTGNTIKNSMRAAIETHSGSDCENTTIVGNTLVDAGLALLFFANSGGTPYKRNILVSSNVLRQDEVDSDAIRMYEDGEGQQITFTNNLIYGNKAGTSKSALLFSLAERAHNIIFENNTLQNWDIGINFDADSGTEEDWTIGIGLRLENNKYSNVTTPFGIRTGVYAAVGQKNIFTSCLPGYNAYILEAAITNNRLDGFVTTLPTRNCRNGDKLVTYDIPAKVFINNTATPTAVTITNSSAASDTLTITAHGLTVGQRVRAAGSVPAPLYVSGEYYIHTVVDVNTIKLCNFRNATSAIDITADAGTGTLQVLEATPNWIEDRPTYLVEDTGSAGGVTKVFTFTNGLGTTKKVTATGAIALQFIATLPGFYNVIVEMDGTGSHAITYATTVVGQAPPIYTAASAKTLIPLFYDGTTWFHVGAQSTLKFGTYETAPIVRPASISDATGSVDAHVVVNDVLTVLRNLGLIAP